MHPEAQINKDATYSWLYAQERNLRLRPDLSGNQLDTFIGAIKCQLYNKATNADQGGSD